MTTLLADIGGTNARFALLETGAAAPGPVQTLACADFPTLEEAVQHYLQQHGASINRAVLAVAAPPDREPIAFTNQGWSFYSHSLQDTLGLESLHILNDFTAVALAVPHLQPGQDFLQTGGGSPRPDKPIAVLGPGTGLGVSILVPAEKPSSVILTNTEGGHFTLPAMTDRESAVLSILRQRFNHVSAERVISGPGLLNLYQALCQLDGQPSQWPSPADVTEQALNGTCPLAKETLDLFFAFLGTAASNICITVGAYGGVYLAGGILPKVQEAFLASKFRKRFETKGRFSNYLEPTPTYLITHQSLAFLGLTAFCQDLAKTPNA